MAIPLVVGSINIGVEIIIGYGSEYISKPRNYQTIVLEAMGAICGIQFINLSILFVLVSMNIESPLNSLNILKGPYNELNSAWYIEFGTMIVWSMIFEIPMPHGFPILILILVLL